MGERVGDMEEPVMVVASRTWSLRKTRAVRGTPKGRMQPQRPPRTWAQKGPWSGMGA